MLPQFSSLWRVLLAVLALCLGTSSAHAADICSQATFSVNVKAFGAAGDGTTDDTASIRRAAACASALLAKPGSYAAELYFPAGVYPIRDRIAVSGRETSPAAGSLTVRGDGMLASRLIENGQAGILALDFANITTQVQVSQLGFFTTVPGGGTALAITMPAKGLLDRRSVVLRDLTLGGIDIHRDYFETGILLYATSRPLIDDVMMAGPYGPGSGALVQTGTCFDLRGTYSPTIVDSACWSEGTGLQMSGLDTGKGRMEGVFVTRSKFVNVDYGIVIRNEDRMPEGMISENHINAHVTGLYLDGKKFMTVRDNLFYHEKTRDGHVYNDISLDNTEKILLTGNIFHFPSDTNRVAIHIENSRDDTIASNMFNQPGSGITIGHGVLNTEILQNRFFVQDLIKHVPLNQPSVVDNGIGTHIVSLGPETGNASARAH
jgi:hypothetical protein